MMIRCHLPQVLIVIIFLFVTGCASTGQGGGFPFFGKKSEAPPPATMMSPQMMSPQMMPGQEIQVQPAGAGPNAPPAGEIIGQPEYIPPASQPSSSVYSSPSSYPSSTPSSYSSPSSSTVYGSAGGVSSGSTPSPSSTYPSSSSSSGSSYSNPSATPSSSSSGSYSYPSSSGSASPSGSYGPTTSTPAPVNRHYAAKVQTYSPSSISNSSSSNYNQNGYQYQPSVTPSYQNEIPVTQLTARTAVQHTQLKGGTLSVHASSTPESLIQNGVYTRVGHGQVTIQPVKVSYESQAGEIPQMSGEMAENRKTDIATYNPNSKWDDSERYVGVSMWEAMAAQNVNAILGTGKPSYLAENTHFYAKPLTAQDYQIVVRGQAPKKADSPVLIGSASAIISGSIY